MVTADTIVMAITTLVAGILPGIAGYVMRRSRARKDENRPAGAVSARVTGNVTASGGSTAIGIQQNVTSTTNVTHVHAGRQTTAGAGSGNLFWLAVIAVGVIAISAVAGRAGLIAALACSASAAAIALLLGLRRRRFHPEAVTGAVSAVANVGTMAYFDGRLDVADALGSVQTEYSAGGNGVLGRVLHVTFEHFPTLAPWGMSMVLCLFSAAFSMFAVGDAVGSPADGRDHPSGVGGGWRSVGIVALLAGVSAFILLVIAPAPAGT